MRALVGARRRPRARRPNAHAALASAPRSRASAVDRDVSEYATEPCAEEVAVVPGRVLRALAGGAPWSDNDRLPAVPPGFPHRSRTGRRRRQSSRGRDPRGRAGSIEGPERNVTEAKTPVITDSWSLFLMLRMRPPLPRPERRSNAMSTPPTPPRSGAFTSSPSDRGGGKGFRNAEPHRPDDLTRPPSPFPHFSPPSCQRWDFRRGSHLAAEPSPPSGRIHLKW